MCVQRIIIRQMGSSKSVIVSTLKRHVFSAVIWRRCILSRRRAIAIRSQLIQERGYSVVDSHNMKRIKRYCKDVLGSSSYWPWVATYMEMRGEYREGWIPEDYFIFRVLPKINPIEASHISIYKTMDYRLFGEACIRPVLLILDRLIFDPDFNQVSLSQAYDLLRGYSEEVIIKRDDYSGGHKTRFAYPRDIRLEEMLGKGKFIIQPVVRQHPIMAEVYPKSVNSIRVLTYLDNQSVVSVKSVIMVAGAKGSRLSNAAQGGRYFFIGDDGRPFTKAYMIVNNYRKTEDVHPETGFMYKNLRLPFMKEVKELCIHSHYRYPYAGFIGWDVYIDESGQPRLLEWNAKLPVFWDTEAMAGPCFDINELKTWLRG